MGSTYWGPLDFPFPPLSSGLDPLPSGLDPLPLELVRAAALDARSADPLPRPLPLSELPPWPRSVGPAEAPLAFEAALEAALAFDRACSFGICQPGASGGGLSPGLAIPKRKSDGLDPPQFQRGHLLELEARPPEPCLHGV